MHQHPVLRFSNKIIVVDIYDPIHLEQLEQARDLGEATRRLQIQVYSTGCGRRGEDIGSYPHQQSDSFAEKASLL